MMSSIYIDDLDRLRKILENTKHPSLREIYRSYIGEYPVSAKLDMYEHQNGCRVKGLQGRWWVYVNVKGKNRAEYDIALWKLVRNPEVRYLLSNTIKIENESEDYVTA